MKRGRDGDSDDEGIVKKTAIDDDERPNNTEDALVFYFILFYFILFYFILFYFILFYFILFYYLQCPARHFLVNRSNLRGFFLAKNARLNSAVSPCWEEAELFMVQFFSHKSQKRICVALGICFANFLI